MGICLFVVGGILGTYGTYIPGGLHGNLSVSQARPINLCIMDTNFSKGEGPSPWKSRIRRHRILLPPRTRIRSHFGTRRLGLRS